MLSNLYKILASSRPLTPSYIYKMIETGDFNISSLPPPRASYVLIDEADIDNYFKLLIDYYELDFNLEFVRPIYRRTLTLFKGENTPLISAEMAIKNNDVVALDYLITRYEIPDMKWLIDITNQEWTRYNPFKYKEMSELFGYSSEVNDSKFRLYTLEDVNEFLSSGGEITPQIIREMTDNGTTFPALDRALAHSQITEIYLNPGTLKYRHLFDKHHINITNLNYIELTDINIVNSLTYNRLNQDFIDKVISVVRTDSQEEELLEFILDFGDWITATLIISHVYRVITI